jgi:hypothetical protein
MRKQILLILTYLSMPCLLEAATAYNPEDSVSQILPDLLVTSAENSKTARGATPQQTINSENIKLRGITDISDAMRRLPGVNLRDYGGAGGMKTVSVRGLGSEHTAIVYDGVALSDCQSGQIDLSRYSLDNVSSLTLYAGENDDIFLPAKAAASASSLYISSFLAPSTSSRSISLRAKMTVGEWSYYNPYINFAQSLGNGFSWSGNAEFSHSKNDYPFTLINGDLVTRERRENSQMNAWHAELNGRWDSAMGTLAAKVYYYDNARYLPGPVIYYVSNSNEHLRERNFFGQLNYKGRLSSKVSLLATGKFNWSTSRYTDINGKYPGGTLDDYYIQRETYMTASALYIPCRGVSLDYSADWTWNNLSSNLPGHIDPYRNSLLQTLAAKYSSGHVTILARILYSLYLNGARHGDAGSNASRWSPALSVSYKPFSSQGFYVRGSYKNIFRMPTFNEAYFDHYGSINLDPETTDQLNVGLTYETSGISFLDNLTVTCDGYMNHVRNKIVAVPYNMFIWTMTNLGKVRVFGLDVTLNGELRLHRAHSLLLSGTYSYQRAQPRTSPDKADWMKQVAYIPLNSGSGSLTWMNPWVNLVAHFTAVSARYTNSYNLPGTRIPGYADTGLALFRDFRVKHTIIEGRFDLLNLFDKQYEIVAQYPMPGRSWKVSVEVKF